MSLSMPAFARKAYGRAVSVVIRSDRRLALLMWSTAIWAQSVLTSPEKPATLFELFEQCLYFTSCLSSVKPLF